MGRTIRILYAEDNLQDADQTRFRMGEDAPELDIEIADTGKACLARLQRPSSTSCCSTITCPIWTGWTS